MGIRMKMRIVLAGELPEDQQLFEKVDLLTEQISAYLRGENAQAGVQMLVSPAYTGQTWVTWSGTHNYSLCKFTTHTMENDWGRETPCEQTIQIDTSLRSLLGEAMCDKADVLLMVWNEDVTERSGATWELMRIAYDRKVPCIWISTKSQQVYCLWEAYYKKYDPEYLNAMSGPLPGETLRPEEVEEKTGRLMAFWEKRRMNYLKKYKADNALYPSVEDSMLKQDFKMEEKAAKGETLRRILLDQFQRFDAAAIRLNTRFQTMLYQRSVLPFLATLFLAVGFYAETLVGKTISGIAPQTASVMTIFAALLAGTGFLIHACLNLYVYRMSKSPVVYRWQKEFVNDRYVAEILRVLIHLTPYGVGLDLRKLCGRDRELYMKIKHLTDDAEPAKQHLDRGMLRCILQHMREMLGDQIAYHESSGRRYQTIVESLEKWGQRIFYIGFWMVFGRGVLQFVLTPLQSVPASFSIGTMSGTDVNGILRSFLNMLALLLPAWAGYFATKAQQNNFRYNLNNHQNMLARLHTMQERVEYFLGQDEIPMEMFDIIIKEFAETMLVEDTIGWQHQYMNLSVKPL